VVNGILSGEGITYYPSGKKESIVAYANDRKNGIYTSYYENDRIRFLAKMKDDSTLCAIKFRDSSLTIFEESNMYPENMAIPDTFSITKDSKMIFALPDSVFMKYYAGVAYFFADISDTVPAYESSAIVQSNNFIFSLPTDIKAGSYWLSIRIKPRHSEKGIFGTEAGIMVLK
jgi:hypothetical protein